jgi:hypothetical protein
MKRSLWLIVTTTLLGSAAACSDEPTAPPAIGPSFDGGFGFGSGHRTPSDSTEQNEATVLQGTVADDSTTTERGGFGFGSGH